MTEGSRRSECRGAISKEVDKVGAQRGSKRPWVRGKEEGEETNRGMRRGQAKLVPSSPPGKDGPRGDKLLKNVRNSSQ